MDIYAVIASGVRSLPVDAVHHALAVGGDIVWVDLGHEEREGMRLLTDLLQAQPDDVDDCSSRRPVPKLHAYTDHYFSAINGLARGIDGRLYFQPLKIFFNAALLITVMGPTSKALTPEAVHRDLMLIRERLRSGGFHPTSAFELVTAIRLQMLRTQESLVTEAAANAAQTHELYVHLIDTLDSQEGLMLLDLRRLNDLRLCFSHLRNTVDLEREYLQEVLDLLQTRVSTELNRFVRKITAWGTIGIAWTVIVGIYGMNFDDIPGLGWRFGYAFAFGLMALVGFVLAFMFRRRGWL
jgi:magnesium transporter